MNSTIKQDMPNNDAVGVMLDLELKIRGYGDPHLITQIDRVVLLRDNEAEAIKLLKSILGKIQQVTKNV